MRGPPPPDIDKRGPLVKNIGTVKKINEDSLAQNINILKKIHKRLIQIKYDYKNI